MARRLLQACRVHPVLEDDGGTRWGVCGPVEILFDALLKLTEGADLEKHLVEEDPPPAFDERPPALIERQREGRPRRRMGPPEHGVVLVPKTEIQRQAGTHLPVVLPIPRGDDLRAAHIAWPTKADPPQEL